MFPTFSLNGGNYNNDQSVTLNTTTPSSMIRYTLDGTTPTETIGTEISPGTAIILNTNNTVIKAIAYRFGYQSSVVITLNTFNFIVATLTSSPTAGTYTSYQNVTLSTTTSGAEIRYTINGSDPTSTTGTVYNGTPIPLSSNGTYTIRAKAFKNNYQDSGLLTRTYIINVVYNLNYSSNYSAAIGINSSIPGTSCGSGCISYNENTTVTLIGSASGCYYLLTPNWGGACSGNNPCNLIMDSNKTVNLRVGVRTYLLTTYIIGSGQGNLSNNYPWIGCNNSSCTFYMQCGSTFSIKATANPGSVFTAWS